MKPIKKIPRFLFAALEKKPISVLIILSFALNCFIEVMGRRSPADVLTYMVTRPHLFLLNTFIIMCSFLIILLIQRRAFIVLLISTLWVVCGITNYSLMFLRALPFTARDIFLVYDGLKVAKAYFSVTDIILIATGAAAVLFLLVLSFFKLPKCRKPPKYSRQIITVASLVLILVFITTVGTGDIALASDYENINAAYDDCGFAFCFTSSIFDSGIGKPDDYSQDKMEALKAQLDAIPDSAGKKPNIIYIQLESFFDPSTINGLSYSKNPIPVFTQLKQEFPSGFLCVPALGAGTVNTEFEILTGMSLDYFGVGEYPYDSTFRSQTCESLAYNLKSIGYGAYAIHNHSGTFYSRNIVYANLGFDSFTSLEYMKDIQYNETGWAKDAVLEDCIMDTLNASNKSGFIFAVTAQGHGKYPTDFIDSPISVEETEQLEIGDPEALEYYMYQLEETDRFIGSLIERLKSYPEDVVLVLYGDHLPALGISPEFHTTRSLYNTEYIVWNNFGMKGDDKDLFAYRLSAHVLDMVDIRKGTIFKYHQSCFASANYFKNLEMLEYDMIFGEKYVYNGVNPFAPTDLHMGLEDILLTKAGLHGDLSYISGSGFTPFSVVYVNGNRRNTDYINPSLLYVDCQIKEGDTVEVCQAGDDNVPLSSTGGYTVTTSDLLPAEIPPELAW